jgi:hypothetical protein
VTIEGPQGSPFESEDIPTHSRRFVHLNAVFLFRNRWYFQPGAVSARGLPYGTAQGPVLDEDLPPEHWCACCSSAGVTLLTRVYAPSQTSWVGFA